MRSQFFLKVVGVLLLALATQISFAQNKVVTGKVIDARDGSAIPGVTVSIKGTKTAVQTRADGSYSISVPNNAQTLVISSVGFTTQEITISSLTNADVALVINNTALGEVVVIGYGTQRRKEVTGSIAKVNADKIQNVPAPSFESALAGKAAGVQVITSGGAAGSGAIIRIRGISSISVAGDPLYVIDGLPVDATYLNTNTRNRLGQDRNPLSNINPDDIVSIEIL
jgi:hypothetical protein